MTQPNAPGERTSASPQRPPEIDDSLVASLRGLDASGRLLFATRILRMFGYGFLAVVLVLYLAAVGLDPGPIGLILTLTLLGDTLISLWLTTRADRIGRRTVLIAGSLLMVAAGVVFASTDVFLVLVIAGVIGVISPTGNEVGPFLAVEQAALSQSIPDVRRTPTFAWYNLAGYVATAVGALAAGLVSQALIESGVTAVDAYRAVVIGYAFIGVAMALLFFRVGPEVEAPRAGAEEVSVRRRLGSSSRA